MSNATDTKVIMALVTAPAEEATAIARALVEPKHVACVNIIPTAHSVYWWEGELRDDPESLLILKSTKDKIDAIRETIAATISYETFEFLAFDVTDGNQPYLDWVRTTVV